jgi:hypothetical protein
MPSQPNGELKRAISRQAEQKRDVMTQHITQMLAEIHSNFGIFDRASFRVDDSENIIHHLSGIPELAYLHQFYLDYKSALEAEFGKRQGQVRQPLRTKVAKSVDLPFIGESVIQTGHAKYLFVFEGSLASTEKLSVNVLACLWPLEGMAGPLHGIRRKFWCSPYDYIVDRLSITSEVAKHSYVVDAVRIGIPGGKKPDREQNRRLLQQEIDLLKPRLVVLVGKTAERTIWNKTQKGEEGRYFPVPFPTKTRSEKGIKKAAQKYDELKRKYEEL